MARIIYCHPSQTKHAVHLYTDLDFWDARRILKKLPVVVKRNFGEQPSGDEFPTQVVGDGLDRLHIKDIEKRLKRAIVSPPRHVIVRAMVMEECFSFEPAAFYPSRWSQNLMIHFTYMRLPLDQSALCNPHQTVEIVWKDGHILLRRVQRDSKYYQVIRTARDAEERLHVPSCF